MIAFFLPPAFELLLQYPWNVYNSFLHGIQLSYFSSTLISVHVHLKHNNDTNIEYLRKVSRVNISPLQNKVGEEEG